MPDLQTLFLEAANARKRGDPRRAREQFAAILEQFPGCHEAFYMHGMLSAELGDLAAAERDLRDALRLDGGNPEYLFRLGSVLLALGRIDEAADTLLDAEKEGEESAPLLAAVGSACLGANRLADAERACRRAYELDPKNVDAAMSLVMTLVGLKKMDAAVRLSLDTASEHPTRPDVLASVAHVLERANRIDEASDLTERALAINPNEPTALGVRATILQRAGNKAESVPVFERALALTRRPHDRRELSRKLGLVLDELGRHDDAYPRFVESKPPPDAASDEFVRFVGRYVESCKRGMTAQAVAAWRDPPPDTREPPVFFVGFPRSGTTLLEQILAAHPRLATTDEIDSIGRCTEWIVHKAGGPESAPAQYARLTDAELVALREMYWSKIVEDMGAPALVGKRLVDKHPLNTASLYTARRLFPRSKVIVSIRDPRDVILSCFMQLSRSPMAIASFRDLESAARLYESVMGLWLHMRATLGLPWLEVRYEDLVDDAEATARRVLDFLGERWDDSVLSFTERAKKKTIMTPSYQQVAQPIYKRAKGRWRAYVRRFGTALDILAPFVQALGYADR